MTRDQTDTFRLDEGDNWFRRNEAALDPNRRDYVIDMGPLGARQGAGEQSFADMLDLGVASEQSWAAVGH